MMNIEQMQRFALQFITHATESVSTIQSAQIALDGGCRWIQLRMKDADEDEVERTALDLLPLCRAKKAVLIIDDHVGVCQRVQADGVHLGKTDMKPAEARKILGDKYIIGGTCNTFADVQAIYRDVDYIGCGPFKFTRTKKNLAPVLGIEGYQKLIWQCRSKGINTPIVAIGGIGFTDIKDILLSGPNGIALSSSVLAAANPLAEMQRIVDKVQHVIDSQF